MDEEGRIFYAECAGTHVLRFVGDVRYPLATGLARFVDGIFQSTPCPTFAIDLTETHLIDSTNLGLLARIAMRLRRCGAAPVSIISDRQDINEVLFSIGFDEVFDIVQPNGSLPQVSDTLPVHDRHTAATTQTVLEAHRSLMDLNARNRAAFQDVVSLLEHQIQNRATAPDNPEQMGNSTPDSD